MIVHHPGAQASERASEGAPVCIAAGRVGGWADTRQVSEFMHGGALNKKLWGTAKLPWTQRMQYACDVAEGMMFLHSVPVIHRVGARRLSVFPGPAHSEV